MKLQLAMVFAKDLARMTAFYRDGLGLRLIPEKSTTGWAVFDAEGTLFGLHEMPATIAVGIHIKDPPEARTDTPIKLVFETAEMEALCTRIEGLGAKIISSGSSGRRDAIDPEGNVFQLKRALP